MQHSIKSANTNRVGQQSPLHHGLNNTSARYVGPPSMLQHFPIPLDVNDTKYYTSLAPDSQQLFQFNWSISSYLGVYCRGIGLQRKAEMYLKFGSPPTLDIWDRQSQPYYDGLAIEMLGSPPLGTYYLLLHGLAYYRLVSVEVDYLIT